MINWQKINGDDIMTIHEIAKRALKNKVVIMNSIDLQMDISAAHINEPIELEALLKANDMDFAHDINGIVRNINRETGEMRNCFSPRYSANLVS